MSHVPRLYPSVSQALQRPLEQSVAALLPSSETGEAEAEARLCLLAEAWAEALAAAAALGAALRGGDAAVAAAAAGVSSAVVTAECGVQAAEAEAEAEAEAAVVARAQQAVLQPFEREQRLLGALLRPRLLPRVPALISLAELMAREADISMHEALAAAAASVERGSAELLELLQQARMHMHKHMHMHMHMHKHMHMHMHMHMRMRMHMHTYNALSSKRA